MLEQKKLREAFSRRLRELMAEKGLNQKMLAAGVGTSQQVVEQYVNEKSAPKMEMSIALAVYFGVSTDYLFGRVDIKPDSVEVQEVAKEYGLTERSLETLFGLVEARGRGETRGEDSLMVLNAILMDRERAFDILKKLYEISFVDIDDIEFTVSAFAGERALNEVHITGSMYRDMQASDLVYYLAELRENPTVSMRRVKLDALERVALPKKETAPVTTVVSTREVSEDGKSTIMKLDGKVVKVVPVIPTTPPKAARKGKQKTKSAPKKPSKKKSTPTNGKEAKNGSGK